MDQQTIDAISKYISIPGAIGGTVLLAIGAITGKYLDHRFRYELKRQGAVAYRQPETKTIEDVLSATAEENSRELTEQDADYISHDICPRVKIVGTVSSASDILHSPQHHYQAVTLADGTGELKVHIEYGSNRELDIDSFIPYSALILKEGDEVTFVGIPLTNPAKEHHPNIKDYEDAQKSDFYVGNLLPVSYAKLLQRTKGNHNREERNDFNSVWGDYIVKMEKRYGLDIGLLRIRLKPAFEMIRSEFGIKD